ncbi:hypothetical protein K437DRAFT_185343 [Tilletiaria anomala UBC 951]|uniref:Uncharacterized protein n=1 Tax=Tilletiaria anomala (strain ATCC 24038 / CBS 436.72 / UBC 951) TaxID=1037660 RepID=A0A066VJW0_TILAU|nr:uncharacterized protein K437DRAFT_185343 [Tilletiaria anomala UBC 951]KDN40613.1 hypothetical protein K437DRAFT_185343 [Tilletiaria anomala UBC 951]
MTGPQTPKGSGVGAPASTAFQPRFLLLQIKTALTVVALQVKKCNLLKGIKATRSPSPFSKPTMTQKIAAAFLALLTFTVSTASAAPALEVTGSAAFVGARDGGAPRPNMGNGGATSASSGVSPLTVKLGVTCAQDDSGCISGYCQASKCVPPTPTVQQFTCSKSDNKVYYLGIMDDAVYTKTAPPPTQPYLTFNGHYSTHNSDGSSGEGVNEEVLTTSGASHKLRGEFWTCTFYSPFGLNTFGHSSADHEQPVSDRVEGRRQLQLCHGRRCDAALCPVLVQHTARRVGPRRLHHVAVADLRLVFVLRPRRPGPGEQIACAILDADQR